MQLYSESIVMRLIFAICTLIFLGCDGHKLGFQVLDGKPTLIAPRPGPGSKPIIREFVADPATLRELAPLTGAPVTALRYAVDKTHAFIELEGWPVRLDADPLTFQIISKEGHYAKDKNDVWYRGAKLENADPLTFQILEAPYAKDKNQGYVGRLAMKVRDPAAFTTARAGESGPPICPTFSNDGDTEKTEPRNNINGWARDGIIYYYVNQPIFTKSYQDFEILNDYYAKDREFVYFGMDRYVHRIKDADAATFQVDKNYPLKAHDKDGRIERGKRTPKP